MSHLKGMNEKIIKKIAENSRTKSSGWTSAGVGADNTAEGAGVGAHDVADADGVGAHDVADADGVGAHDVADADGVGTDDGVVDAPNPEYANDPIMGTKMTCVYCKNEVYFNLPFIDHISKIVFPESFDKDYLMKWLSYHINNLLEDDKMFEIAETQATLQDKKLNVQTYKNNPPLSYLTQENRKKIITLFCKSIEKLELTEDERSIISSTYNNKFFDFIENTIQNIINSIIIKRYAEISQGRSGKRGEEEDA